MNFLFHLKWIANIISVVIFEDEQVLKQIQSQNLFSKVERTFTPITKVVLDGQHQKGPSSSGSHT